jgi:hypothetical protein
MLASAISPKAGSAEVFGPEIFQEIRFVYAKMDALAGQRFKPSIVAHQAFDEPVFCVKVSYQLGVPERTEDLLGFVTHTLGDLLAHSRALSGPDDTREYWDAINALELLDVFFLFFPDRVLPNIVEPASPEWSGLSADWNSGCVDRELGYSDVQIPSTARIGAEDVRERISLSGDQIMIEGQIKPGFSDRLEHAIRLHPEARIVAISSNGGSVEEAIEAGRVIRSNGLSTMLENSCDSACALVFLGGVERLIYQPAPQIRMHQLALPSSDGALFYIDVSNEIYEEIGDYVSEMGANRTLYIELMGRSTDLEQVVWGELCEARIATWIQRYCWVDP